MDETFENDPRMAEIDPMLPAILRAIRKHREALPFTAPEAMGWRWSMLGSKLNSIALNQFHDEWPPENVLCSDDHDGTKSGPHYH
jgi:hypothetical protein